MASGSILGECTVCNDLIWEDEIDFVGDLMLHDRCKKAYIKGTYHMTEEQFEKLIGVNQIRKEIEELRQMEESRHNFELVAIKALEEKFNKILDRVKN